jgi:hypothetical protein
VVNAGYIVFTVTLLSSGGGDIGNNRAITVGFTKTGIGAYSAMPSYYQPQTNVAASQRDGSVINYCYEIANMRMTQAIYGLLIQSGIDPIYIEDEAIWNANFLASGMGNYTLTTLLPKPVGIKTLLDEICNLNALVWWDDRAQLIRCKPLVFQSTITEAITE